MSKIWYAEAEVTQAGSNNGKKYDEIQRMEI